MTDLLAPAMIMVHSKVAFGTTRTLDGHSTFSTPVAPYPSGGADVRIFVTPSATFVASNGFNLGLSSILSAYSILPTTSTRLAHRRVYRENECCFSITVPHPVIFAV